MGADSYRHIEYKLGAKSAVGFFLPRDEAEETFNGPQSLDQEILQVMLQVVKPGDTVIDGGANIGLHSLALSQLVGPTGQVIAIEPGHNNLPRLHAHLRLNKTTNVKVIEQPLWSTNTEVTLHHTADGGSNSLIDQEGKSLSVMNGEVRYVEGVSCPHGAVTMQAITLNDLPPAKLLKLDCEGAEEAILSVLVDSSKYPFIIVELNEWILEKFGGSQTSLRNMTARLGYETFLLPKIGVIVPILCPRETAIVPRYANTNVLFSTVDRVGASWTHAYDMLHPLLGVLT